jgi:hypothetical protein
MGPYGEKSLFKSLSVAEYGRFPTNRVFFTSSVFFGALNRNRHKQTREVSCYTPIDSATVVCFLLMAVFESPVRELTNA